MSKEEFMALTAEEMYNKYKVADEMWSYNMKQSSDYKSEIMKKDEEIAELHKQLDGMRNTIIILGRML
jgi:hypothetical protein